MRDKHNMGGHVALKGKLSSQWIAAILFALHFSLRSTAYLLILGDVMAPWLSR